MTTEELRNEAHRLYNEVATPEAFAEARKLYAMAADDKDVVSAVSLGAISFDIEDLEDAKKWWDNAFDWYKANPTEEAASHVAFAHARYGDLIMDAPASDADRRQAIVHYTTAIEMGCTDCRANLGLCMMEDGSKPDVKGALEVWKKGMDEGDHQCAFRYCAHFVDNGKSDQAIVDILEALVRDEDDPCADACALLYYHYSRVGDDDLAAEWLECGLEMFSDMCEDIADEVRNG